MSSIAEAFRTGGIWMYLIFLLQLTSIPLAAIAGFLTFKQKRVPWIVWALIPLTILCAASLGEYIGLQETFDALQRATPETRMKLMARGIALSLNVKVFGGLSLLFSSLLAAFALAISTLAGTPRPRKPSPAPAGIALAVGTLSALGVVGAGLATQGSARAGIFAATFIFSATICCVLIHALRTDVQEHMPRIASARLGCAVLCILALLGGSIMLSHLSMVEVFSALERASPEARLAILARGFEYVRTDQWIGRAAMACALGFGVLPSLLSIKSALDTRGLLGAALSSVALIGALIFSFALSSANSSFMENQRIPHQRWTIQSSIHSPTSQDTPSYMSRYDWRPHSDFNAACVLHRQDEQWMLSEVYASGSPWDTDACQTDPGAECTSQPGVLQGPLCPGFKGIGLLVPADMPGATFTGTPWGDEPREMLLAIDAHIDASDTSSIDPRFLPMLSSPLSGTHVTWYPPSTQKPVFSSLLTHDSESGHYTLNTNEGPERVDTIAQLDKLLEALAQKGDLPTMAIAPSDSMTMQQLATVCIIKRAHEIKASPPTYLDEGASSPSCLVIDELAVATW